MDEYKEVEGCTAYLCPHCSNLTHGGVKDSYLKMMFYPNNNATVKDKIKFNCERCGKSWLATIQINFYFSVPS